MCRRSEHSLRFVNLTWVMLSHTLLWALAGFSSSQAVGLRASVLRWLLARGLLQLLAMWASPVGRLLHQSKRAGRRACRQDGSHGPLYPVTFAIFCSLDLSHLVQPALKERVLHQGTNTRWQGSWGHLRKLSATTTKPRAVVPFHNLTNE